MINHWIAKAALLLLTARASAQVNVAYDRLLHASAEPQNWLTYNGDYSSHRHSSLSQITRDNVAKIHPLWIYQSREAGKWECTPLVVNGVLYITERPNIVTAIDGRTGRPLWTYHRALPDDVTACCGPVNRGLAILGDALYLATFDCHLVCIDANTGTQRWDTTVIDYHNGHSMTLCPLAVKDKIIVGISGGEYGIRGFLDAYDAKTGKQAWRFWTIPSPGEKGSETWGDNDNWKHAGGAMWVTGSYDPEQNLLFWGTGNPGPDYNGADRPGDNLYTCCVVALDVDTGKLKWHFQYTPHDVHDWDSNQVPILIDTTIDEKPRKLLIQANRNAFYYVLDRVTGEFINGNAFAKQNWSSGLDAHGHPVVLPHTEPSREGTLIFPGLEGAVNWPAPSYSPETGLYYIHAQDDYGQTFFLNSEKYEPGRDFTNGAPQNLLGHEPHGAVKAIEATTGKIRWEFREQMSSNGGILTTSSNLLFTGTRDGYFYALDATTGEALYHFQAGASIHGGTVTFLVDGKQCLAVIAGQGLFVFGL